MSLAIGVESSGKVSMSVPGEETFFVHENEYCDGDVLVLTSSLKPCHVILQLDETLPPSLVYLAGSEFRFTVPFAEKRVCYSPRAFTGKRHLLAARFATSEEIGLYRNLALNPHDIHGGHNGFSSRQRERRDQRRVGFRCAQRDRRPQGKIRIMGNGPLPAGE